ncbi:MAG: wax ester/triacylglycerol synthase family O-acyltransferase [Halioglobus sp.]
MAKYYYDILTPTDYGFLVHESPKEHMHVTGLATFSAGPLASENGGINFEKLKKAVADVLHRVPRYRQKLMWIEEEKKSLLGKVGSWVQPNTEYPPVWVDDEQFDIDFHVRHTSLPRPGNDEQLKTLVGQIMSVQLDRARPLWEVYIIEGMADGGFACITKMHHCMVDGESGMGLTAVLMHIDANHVPEDGPRYRPRPAPTQAELKKEARKAQFRKPWTVFQDLQEFGKQSDNVGKELVARTKAVGELLSTSMAQKRADSPINGETSAQRIYEWLDLPLDKVKAIAKTADATVNDVVLTLVTGAMRDYCGVRGFDVNKEPFRVSAPVSMRRHTGKKNEEGDMGNEVTQWTVPLPIDVPSPRKQLAAIHAETVAMKDSTAVLAAQTITSILSLSPGLMGAMMGQASVAVNTVVTNMPGPQFALYQCGAEMQVARPCVPLNGGLGIVIGVLSYNGTISFGLTGDPAIMDDLQEFREMLEKAFHALIKSTRVGLEPKTEDKTGKKTASKKKVAKKAPVKKAAAKKAASKKPAARNKAAPKKRPA